MTPRDVPQACEADAPALPAATPSSWKHPISSRLVTAAGRPNHRARDAFYVEGEPPDAAISRRASCTPRSD